MPDIQNKEDVKKFVDAFYQKVALDQLLGPVFAAKIPNGDWTVHLERMYGFWNTILFDVREYSGNPFSQHASLPIDGQHFQRWLDLFNATIDEQFAGEHAEEVKERAHKMGLLFESKLAYLRQNQNFKNLL